MQCHYCKKTINSDSSGIRLGETDLFFCHSCYQTYQIKETNLKYYLDCEFLEGPQRRRFFGIPMFGIRFDENEMSKLYKLYTKPTIDLISIGIVAEDGREYYSISKDFNLKEAWNRYQLEPNNTVGARIGCFPTQKKVYWIRENVLKPIFDELILKESNEVYSSYERQFLFNVPEDYTPVCGNDFSYKNLKKLIAKYGKTNKEIAEGIKDFCHFWKTLDSGRSLQNHPIEFYAYYADYDWVVFCWIFGKMIDLPTGFPMYCRDLKQNFDVLAEHLNTEGGRFTPKEWVEMVKETHPDYPKQTNEHNALDDAIFNKALHKFLDKI